MAKKAVATFDAKAGAKHMVKVILFVEQLVEQGKEKEFFNAK